MAYPGQDGPRHAPVGQPNFNLANESEEFVPVARSHFFHRCVCVLC